MPADPNPPPVPELPSQRDPLAGLQQHPLFRCPGATPFHPQDPDAATNSSPAAELTAWRQQVVQLKAQVAAAQQALRVVQADLKQAQQQNVELRRQLDATEADKRQILRQLDKLRAQEPQPPRPTRKASPSLSTPASWPAATTTKPRPPEGLASDAVADVAPLSVAPAPALSPTSAGLRWEALFTGERPSSKATLNDIPLELKAFLTATKAQLRAQTGVTLTERDQVIIALAAYRILVQSGPDLVAQLGRLQAHHPDATRRVHALAAWLLAWLEAQLLRRDGAPML